jgi:hypothetical protein
MMYRWWKQISGDLVQDKESPPETSQPVACEVVTDERDFFREALRPGMSETTYVKVPRQLSRCVLAPANSNLLPEKNTIWVGCSPPQRLFTLEKEILRRMEQGQNRAAPIRDASPQRQAPAFDHCASVRRRAHPDLPRSSAGLRSVGRSTGLQSVSEGADQLG